MRFLLDTNIIIEAVGGSYPAMEALEKAVTSTIVDRAIQIRRAIRIKTPDAIIAATALEASATLITRNTDDFKVVAGLTLLNPWAA